MDWREKAECRGMGWEIFFPPFADYKQAREVCAECEVRVPCLESTLLIEIDRDGMFGGYTPNERALLREKRNKWQTI